MSTNWLHDFFFGSNESTIKALEKLQQVDAEQFQKAFSALEKLQKGQQINADQLQIAFSRLEELQATQKIDAERFESIQKYLDGLQERLADVEEKVETLTEAVGEQEKTLLICTIATAVAVTAITCFVAFCIYQGVKLEREKEKNSLDQDTPKAKLSNVDTTDGTEKLQNNLKVQTI
ncbi:MULTISPECIES: HlyD family secretion protein [unclassified Wolbachia]|uniref:HlyD family secretion protein n=1 Tax=unclassified Wolbachia TaxID=2640676 RepID=UPI00222F40B6|nr:HlyD family secretion protein [Wolbachia endosymbiont (group A) of Apoderus coryli]